MEFDERQIGELSGSESRMLGYSDQASGEQEDGVGGNGDNDIGGNGNDNGEEGNYQSYYEEQNEQIKPKNDSPPSVKVKGGCSIDCQPRTIHVPLVIIIIFLQRVYPGPPKCGKKR